MKKIISPNEKNIYSEKIEVEFENSSTNNPFGHSKTEYSVNSVIDDSRHNATKSTSDADVNNTLDNSQDGKKFRI